MNTHSPIPPAPQFCAGRELKLSLTSNRVLFFAAHLLVMGCNGTQFGRAGGDGSRNAPADQKPIGAVPPDQRATGGVPPDINAYQQIWILSGSNEDYGDMPLAEPSFVTFSSQFIAFRGALLLWVGAGFISHSQALASKIGLDGVFEARAPANLNISFDLAMTISSRLVLGKNLSGHILFQGIESGIADQIRLAGLGGGAANGAAELAISDFLRLPANWQAAARGDDGKA